MNVRPAIVSVPSRGSPVPLARIANVTEPLPEPLAPDVTVIHEVLETAVHVQPAAVVTVMGPPLEEALLLNDSLVGLIEYVHPLACVTVCVWPAIEMAAVRSGPVFAAAVNATVPLPVPLAPEVIEIHVAGVVAVQAQPAGLVTPTDVPAPPAAATDWLAAPSDDAHDPA